MGVIDKENIHQGSQDNSVFVVFEDEDNKKRKEDKDEQKDDEKKDGEKVEFTEDELSLTNEAIRLISLKRELGVDPASTEYDKELKGILELARRAGIKNRNQLIAELREIEYMLGYSDDEPKIVRIYRYMKLRDNVRDSIRKMELLKASK